LADNLTDKLRTDAGVSDQEADLYGIWLTRQAREMRSQALRGTLSAEALGKAKDRLTKTHELS
jgi:hypothetical protein